MVECLICQKHKYEAASLVGLLHPLPIPTRVWEDISLDFIIGLPCSNGMDAILVVVDRFTKYAHFCCLWHPYSAKSVVEVFVKEIVKLHGMPHTIVSYKDPIFISSFWSELFRLQGIQLKMSSTYHPKIDGQTKVLNRGLETYLRCFASEQPRQWQKWIYWTQF